MYATLRAGTSRIFTLNLSGLFRGGRRSTRGRWASCSTALLRSSPWTSRHALMSNALGGTWNRWRKHREKSDDDENPQASAIEVSDRFGSLDRDTILRALGKHDIREDGGGAGMGISLAYRSCDHLVFNLAPGRQTEIVALIDVRYPPTERISASSYNVFVERP